MAILSKTLRLPWQFKGFIPARAEPVPSLLDSDLEESKPVFINAYKSMLEAIAKQDTERLRAMMEPKLYSAVKEGLSDLLESNKKVVLVSPDSACTTDLVNEEIYLWASIERKVFVDYSSWTLGKNISDRCRVNLANVTFCYTKLPSSILKVDVLFRSKTKLLLVDEADQAGEDKPYNTEEEEEQHMLRFETESKLQSRGWFKRFKDALKVLLYAEGYKSYHWPAEYNWIITDVDNALDGNELCMPLEVDP